MATRTLARVSPVGDDRAPASAVTSIDQARTHPGTHPRTEAEQWYPWASRRWPATSVEEVAFVEDLRRMSDTPGDRYERRDVTVLLTALRSGLTADELFERVRSLRPSRLLAAHVDIEARRSTATEAWDAIVADPTPAALDLHHERAATLVPVVIGHVLSVAQRHPRALALAVAEAEAQLVRTAISAALLEEQLDVCLPPSERGIEIGALLYDGCGAGAWCLGAFLARRVGQLAPLRVSMLLGESRVHSRASGW